MRELRQWRKDKRELGEWPPPCPKLEDVAETEGAEDEREALDDDVRDRAA